LRQEIGIGIWRRSTLLMEVCAPLHYTYSTNLRLLNIVQEEQHVFQAHKGLFRYDDVQETTTIAVLNFLNLYFEVSSKIQIRRDLAPWL